MRISGSLLIREKSCGAIVFLKDKEVKCLLLHYEAGHWDFVKGNVEPNENEKETVIRELREETGITDAQFIEGFREKNRVLLQKARRKSAQRSNLFSSGNPYRES